MKPKNFKPIQMKNQIVPGSKVKIVSVQDNVYSRPLIGKYGTVLEVNSPKNEGDACLCKLELSEHDTQMIYSNHLELVSELTIQNKLEQSIRDSLTKLFQTHISESVKTTHINEIMRIAENHAIEYAQWVTVQTGLLDVDDLGSANAFQQDYNAFVNSEYNG